MRMGETQARVGGCSGESGLGRLESKVFHFLYGVGRIL